MKELKNSLGPGELITHAACNCKLSSFRNQELLSATGAAHIAPGHQLPSKQIQWARPEKSQRKRMAYSGSSVRHACMHEAKQESLLVSVGVQPQHQLAGLTGLEDAPPDGIKGCTSVRCISSGFNCKKHKGSTCKAHNL
eukprot:1153641-Pelagomonas_calceolata.AAC.5